MFATIFILIFKINREKCMAKIRNMGTATMKFGEGIIVSGSSTQLYVSGNMTLNADLGPEIQFQEGTVDRAKISVNDSDNLVLHNQTANKHIVFKVNDQGATREGIRVDGAVPEVVVNEGSESLVDFRVESNNNTHMLFVDGGTDAVLVGSNSTNSADVNFFVSGAIGSRGTSTRGTTVFTGDLVVSGTLTAIQRHVCTAKYTADSQNKLFIRFNAAGSNETPSVNNKFVAPSSGRLSYIMIRSTGTPGQTTIGFHRSTDSTADLSTTPIETSNIVMSSANTTHQVFFTQVSNFGPGDIVGLSVDPTANHSNVDITLVFELNFV
jgi:hypothetical protein